MEEEYFMNLSESLGINGPYAEMIFSIPLNQLQSLSGNQSQCFREIIMKATNYLWSKLKWCVLSLFWSVWRDETKYQQIIVKSLRRNIKNIYANF